jgi:4-amino-4-deoxy-L-arabinose transferase-like glycosyltransferase
MAAFFRYPFAFPPRGLALGLLAVLYLLPGLIGHDPWKTDDAVHIAVVQTMLQDSNWLAPHLPGDTGTTFAPLPVWIGVLFAKTLSGLLPLHDAVRLVSGLAGALLLLLTGKASTELHGKDHGPAAVLIAMGCLGLLARIHEAQPAILLLTGFSASLWGMALLPRRPYVAALAVGLGIAGSFLSAGLPGLILTAPLTLLPLAVADWRRAATLGGAFFGLILGLSLCLIWPLALGWQFSERFLTWWQHETANQFRISPSPWTNLADYLKTLVWFAWPALPMSLWVLWRQRRRLSQPAIMLPLSAFVLALFLASIQPDVRNVAALSFLPPLILLAAPGASTLRRGAANAFDWFGMMTFSLLILLVWVGWLAMVAGFPAQIAANAARLLPGFTLDLRTPHILAAAALTLAWLWLIFASPRRSPWRGTSHWAAGTITLWGVLVALWLPAIDYGKSYRSMVEDLARHLPKEHACIAGERLGPAQIASLYYFSGIRTINHGTAKASSCNLLLVQTANQDEQIYPGSGWKKIWEGRRASDRHEHFRLYRGITKPRKDGRRPATRSDAFQPDGPPYPSTGAAIPPDQSQVFQTSKTPDIPGETKP